MPRRRHSSRKAWTLSAVVGAVLIAVLAAWWAVHWHPSPSTFPIQGVDVGQEDGIVDWFSVKAGGADFGYARATIGADVRDSRFEANWAGMYEANVPRGAIHIFSLCRLASDQAANFVRTVPRTDDALPAALALDFHDDCKARPERAVVLREIENFLKVAEGHTGKPMLLLISRRFERHYAVTDAIDRPGWATLPMFPPDYMARPWRIWRASSFRRINGVSGPVNWDVIAQ